MVSVRPVRVFIDPSLVFQQEGALPPLSVGQEEGRTEEAHDVPMSPGRWYVAVAVAPGAEDIDLELFEGDGETMTFVGEDTAVDCYPWVVFQAPPAGESRVVINGPPNAGYLLHLYEVTLEEAE
ncbi:MAG: hypothetical protein ACYTFO_03650 [Planctomycetota bacterium]